MSGRWRPISGPSRTHGKAVATDITCAPIDDRLLRLYFEYFNGTGYLPPPPSPILEAHGKEPQ